MLIPRLSIVVPVTRDSSSFESTLVSVLENRPADCEVVVPHDGSYDDPFDLSDEVRFVVTDRGGLIASIAAGVDAAQARLVHVLTGGLMATAGWVDAGLEKFEHADAGCVAPVIRNRVDHSIIAAGWHDHAGRLADPVRDLFTAGRHAIGAYLQASFWRTDVLRGVIAGFQSDDRLQCGYAYQQLIRQAGWRCVCAHASTLQIDADALPWDVSSHGRGRIHAALAMQFQPGRRAAASCVARALLANWRRPGLWAESMGIGSAAGLKDELAAQIDSRCVPAAGARQVLRIA